MQAKKLPSGRWFARAYDNVLHKQVSFTRDTKKEAERAAREYQYSIKHEVAKSMTFEEAYDLYVNAHPQWSANTIMDYKKWKHTRYEEFLKMRLEDVSDIVLQKWIDEKSAMMSAKSVRNIFCPIRATVKRYRPHQAINVTLPRKSRSKLNLPTEANIRALLEAVEDDPQFCVATYLATFACMRRSEIAALDMSHIDFKKKTIFIEYSLAKGEHGWVRKSPKNGDTRTIVVPELVLDKIKKLGLPHIDNPNQFSSDFCKFRDKHGLPKFRFHDLRHYCAARMLSLKPHPMPISVVCEYGGWRDKDILLNVYDYVIKEVRDESMENWCRSVEALVMN